MADWESKNVLRLIPGVDPEPLNLRTAIREFERRYISAVLSNAGGDKVKAAQTLGIGLSSLYRKLDEVEMEAMNSVPSDTSVNCEDRT